MPLHVAIKEQKISLIKILIEHRRDDIDLCTGVPDASEVCMKVILYAFYCIYSDMRYH